MTKTAHIAPVQGHTDAAWRHFHAQAYGNNHTYYTPFIRLEKGEFRRHDIKDFSSELNANHQLVPQIIFRDANELEALISGLADLGAARIDLNTGCPFPLQTARGRGAGFICNTEEYAKLPQILNKYPNIDFSLKMRLGFNNPDDWKQVVQYLNEAPLSHITMHPRFAKQQYGGEPDLEQFAAFLEASDKPVIYNGDLRTPEDFVRIQNQFPAIAGVMTARGILARPSLLLEVEQGELPREQRIERMLRFHRNLLNHYESTLCGDSQILSKIKPFWEYAEEEIGRKPWKAIKKASNMAKYHSAVAQIDY